MTSWRCWLVLFVAAASAAQAQSNLRVAAGAEVYLVDHATTPRNAPGRHTWLGGAVTVHVRKWSGTLEGLFGALPDTSLSGERDTRITRLAIRFQPAGWIALGPEIEAVRFSADDGVALWRLMGVGARSQTTLGTDRFEATLEAAWFPVTSTAGDYPLGTPMRLETGLNYRVRPRLEFGLAYRTEIFDFDGPGNRERISGLLFGAWYRVRGGS
jgi:hypothetical protein